MVKKLMVLTVGLGLSLSASAVDMAALTRQAENGDVQAQFDLAKEYYNQDSYIKAFQWYEKVASQNYPSAQAILGAMYAEGQGVPQDYAKSFEWYQKSARQGDAQSQYNLGVMYRDGQGVRQNKLTAKQWFGKACDSGFQKGCDNYRKLNEQHY